MNPGTLLTTRNPEPPFGTVVMETGHPSKGRKTNREWLRTSVGWIPAQQTTGDAVSWARLLEGGPVKVVKWGMN